MKLRPSRRSITWYLHRVGGGAFIGVISMCPRLHLCFAWNSSCRHVGCCGMFADNVSTWYSLTSCQGREPVFPTRQSLGLMKAKLKGAETGHSLLKRKSEALTKYELLLYVAFYALLMRCIDKQTIPRYDLMMMSVQDPPHPTKLIQAGRHHKTH